MIPPRNMITGMERAAIESFLIGGSALSGYLAGNPFGGQAVQRLERVWEHKFGRKHAIACNSATSGLLAALVAMGCQNDTDVFVPALSMSATAAVPKFLGSRLHWMDCDFTGCASVDDSLRPRNKRNRPNFPEAVVVTSLFGNAPNPEFRHWDRVVLDNAQGIMAKYGGDESGWVENLALITVTSFNVHKQVNAGEGGIISTNDADLAVRLRDFINHGEVTGKNYECGLNLRMTEISAILVLSQMRRIDMTIETLRAVRRVLNDNLPCEGTKSNFRRVPIHNHTESGCYTWQFRCPSDERADVIRFFTDEGIPCSAMYEPLYRLPALGSELNDPECPEAERLSAETIVFEITNWKY